MGAQFDSVTVMVTVTVAVKETKATSASEPKYRRAKRTLKSGSRLENSLGRLGCSTVSRFDGDGDCRVQVRISQSPMANSTEPTSSRSRSRRSRGLSRDSWSDGSGGDGSGSSDFEKLH